METNDTTTTTPAEGQLPAKEATSPKGAAQDGQTVVTAPATDKGTEGVATPKPQPQVRTFTEAEVEQIKATVKGGYEGTTKKLKEDIAKARADYEALNEQIEENRLAQLLHKTEEEGGDVNAARQIVDLQRQSRAKMKELTEANTKLSAERERLDSLAATLNSAQVKIMARDLVSQYGLTDEDLPKLLKAETPEQMKTTALELKVERLETGKTPTTTTEKTKTTGKSNVDLSKMKSAERIQFIIDHDL